MSATSGRKDEMQRYKVNADVFSAARARTAASMREVMMREVIDAIERAKDEALKNLLAQGVAIGRISAWHASDHSEFGLAVDQDPHAEYLTNRACTIRLNADMSIDVAWHEPWAAPSTADGSPCHCGSARDGGFCFCDA